MTKVFTGRTLASCVTAALLIGPPVGMPASAVESPPIAYHLERLDRGLRELQARFDSSQLALLQKLNRVDLDYLARLGYMIVPDRWEADELAYSPLPRSYDWAASRPKALVVYLPAQVFGAYEAGTLVRWGPVSSGREAAPTPSGLYHLNWKSRGRTSSFNPEWFMPWYFNFGGEGDSFHEYSLPGRPASHACVRLLAVDAKWLYGWGEQWQLDSQGRVLSPGTPVLILGAYDFRAPKPWRSPASLSRPIELPPNPSEDPGGSHDGS
jgi:hypothetical protein